MNLRFRRVFFMQRNIFLIRLKLNYILVPAGNTKKHYIFSSTQYIYLLCIMFKISLIYLPEAV